MSKESNQFNIASNTSFDPNVAQEVGATELEFTPQSDEDASNCEVSLREIWSRQLAKKEEKFANVNPGGNLAQTPLARFSVTGQLANWFK
jgi:hypothetical protein